MTDKLTELAKRVEVTAKHIKTYNEIHRHYEETAEDCVFIVQALIKDLQEGAVIVPREGDMLLLDSLVDWCDNDEMSADEIYKAAINAASKSNVQKRLDEMENDN